MVYDTHEGQRYFIFQLWEILGHPNVHSCIVQSVCCALYVAKCALQRKCYKVHNEKINLQNMCCKVFVG